MLLAVQHAGVETDAMNFHRVDTTSLIENAATKICMLEGFCTYDGGYAIMAFPPLLAICGPCLSYAHFLLPPKVHCVLCPLGWTQAGIVALFARKINVGRSGGG